LHAEDRVYYRVDRAFVTDGTGQSDHRVDTTPYMVRGTGAAAAALAFIVEDGARLLGTITDLPGDKASATAWRDGSCYVIFVQRAAEVIAETVGRVARTPEASPSSGIPHERWPFVRRINQQYIVVAPYGHPSPHASMIVVENDSYPPVYVQVFGPASIDDCRRWLGSLPDGDRHDDSRDDRAQR
jgi:hypothetical protein